MKRIIHVGILCTLIVPLRSAPLEPVVFSRGLHGDIGERDTPEVGEALTEVHLWALRGEYEPFTFAVYNPATAPCPIVVKPTALDRGQGQRLTTIGLRKIEVRALVHGGRLRRGRTRDWWLGGTDQITAPPGGTVRFWNTVHVPTDAEPGQYQGTVTVSAGSWKRDVKIRLTVSEAELVNVPGVHFYLLSTISPYGQYHHALAADKQLRLKPDVEAFYRELKAHGMTGASLKSSDFPYVEGRIDGLIAEVDAALNAGLDGPVLWNLLALVDAAKGGDAYDYNGRMDNWDQERSLARLRLLCSHARAIGKQQGWPEIIVYPIDEPGTQYEKRVFLYRSMDILFETTRELARIGVRSHSTITEPVDNKHNKAPRWSRRPDEMRDLWDRCRPYLSVRNYGYGYPQGRTNLVNELDDARRRGQEVWMYHNPAVMGQDRRCARIYFGLWAWRARLDGVTAWTYPGGRTVQFEMVREGIDDRKTIAVLEKLIADRRGKKKDRQAATRFLGRLREAIKLDGNGFIPDWTIAAEAVALDDLKRRLISHIDRLQRSSSRPE